jgi:hypothetical protein
MRALGALRESGRPDVGCERRGMRVLSDQTQLRGAPFTSKSGALMPDALLRE